MVEVVAVPNISQPLCRAHSDWSRAVLRVCRDAMRPTGLAVGCAWRFGLATQPRVRVVRQFIVTTKHLDPLRRHDITAPSRTSNRALSNGGIGEAKRCGSIALLLRWCRRRGDGGAISQRSPVRCCFRPRP